MTDRLKTFLITGLGAGFLKPAPGTWGSLLCCLLIFLPWWLTRFNYAALIISAAAVTLLATLGCVLLGGHAEKRFGKKDPGQCTLDEFAGQALAILAIPFCETLKPALIAMLCCFLAFRFFDITKPPPANGLQRLQGGWGIVVDDLIAGLYAAVLTRFILIPIFYYVLNTRTACPVFNCG